MDKIDTDDLRRMNAARIGPQVTCPASRHAGMIAEALIAGNEDQQHQGGSIASTVASLWEARAEILASRAREAELQAEIERLRGELADGSFYKETDIDAMQAEIAQMKAALQDIAKQNKTDELETECDVEFADFEDGYDMCIDRARAALNPTGG